MHPTICIKPVYAEYLSNSCFKIQFQLYNFSNKNWGSISQLNNVLVQTPKAKVIVKDDIIQNSEKFSLPAGATKTITLTFRGNTVKHVVNLPKEGKIQYSIDIYAAQG